MNPPHVTLGLHGPSHRHSLRSVFDYLGSSELDAIFSSHRHEESDKEAVAFPNFDVRETPSTYFLEGEFPGIHDPLEIVIEPLGAKGLSIEARTTDMDLKDEWGVDVIAPHHRRDSRETRRHPDVQTSSLARPEESAPRSEYTELDSYTQQTEEHPTRPGSKPNEPTAGEKLTILLSERHVGRLRRSFSFPESIDFDNMKAKLKDGILRIKVPKSSVKKRSQRVAVEYAS